MINSKVRQIATKRQTGDNLHQKCPKIFKQKGDDAQ